MHYAIVDIETTGSHKDHDAITEIAIYTTDGRQIKDEYHSLINPGTTIPYFIQRLTGIDDEMIADAPSFGELAQDIYDQLNGKIFVAHNVHFDYNFVKSHLERHGFTLQAKRLCTVRLSRKIIPGLPGYGLGKITNYLQIPIEGRHRAYGDAKATTILFHLLMERDNNGIIARALNQRSRELNLPSNLTPQIFHNLPLTTGVYYLHNRNGKVIYVGKALNIKQRMAQHFCGDFLQKRLTGIMREIHDITFELTGSELIALLKESEEIRKHWPRYNRAQKRPDRNYAIINYFDRLDRNRLTIGPANRHISPIAVFASKSEAMEQLTRLVFDQKLCPYLNNLTPESTTCILAEKESCACQMPIHEYNDAVEVALNKYTDAKERFMLLGEGRQAGERSVVCYENGQYLGFGYFDADEGIYSFEEAREKIDSGAPHPAALRIVRSYLRNPRDCELVAC